MVRSPLWERPTPIATENPERSGFPVPLFIEPSFPCFVVNRDA
jgi:hypothetical protein